MLNAYAERISGAALSGLLAEKLKGRGGRIEWGELALVEEDGDRQIGHELLRAVGGDEQPARSPRSTNPTVKAVRALHLRKERDETGLFVAEGLKNVTEGVETRATRRRS